MSSAATATTKPSPLDSGKARIQQTYGATAAQRATATVELAGPQRSHSLEPSTTIKSTALASAGASIIQGGSAVSNTLLVNIFFKTHIFS